VYNVGSGRETSIRDVLERLLQLAGVEATVITDPKRVRPDEQLRVCADVSKIRTHTGWMNRVTMDETLRDVLDDWMSRVNE
jgi:GDP-4-dehydro-6-deoxy-D-mannose reductase